jgi:hypothetical protein
VVLLEGLPPARRQHPEGLQRPAGVGGQVDGTAQLFCFRTGRTSQLIVFPSPAFEIPGLYRWMRKKKHTFWNSGMRSRTVVLWPARCSDSAVVMPARPPPMMMTRFGVEPLGDIFLLKKNVDSKLRRQRDFGNGLT